MGFFVFDPPLSNNPIYSLNVSPVTFLNATYAVYHYACIYGGFIVSEEVVDFRHLNGGEACLQIY